MKLCVCIPGYMLPIWGYKLKVTNGISKKSCKGDTGRDTKQVSFTDVYWNYYWHGDRRFNALKMDKKNFILTNDDTFLNPTQDHTVTEWWCIIELIKSYHETSEK